MLYVKRLNAPPTGAIGPGAPSLVVEICRTPYTVACTAANVLPRVGDRLDDEQLLPGFRDPLVELFCSPVSPRLHG